MWASVVTVTAIFSGPWLASSTLELRAEERLILNDVDASAAAAFAPQGELELAPSAKLNAHTRRTTLSIDYTPRLVLPTGEALSPTLLHSSTASFGRALNRTTTFQSTLTAILGQLSYSRAARLLTGDDLTLATFPPDLVMSLTNIDLITTLEHRLSRRQTLELGTAVGYTGPVPWLGANLVLDQERASIVARSTWRLSRRNSFALETTAAGARFENGGLWGAVTPGARFRRLLTRNTELHLWAGAQLTRLESSNNERLWGAVPVGEAGLQSGLANSVSNKLTFETALGIATQYDVLQAEMLPRARARAALRWQKDRGATAVFQLHALWALPHSPLSTDDPLRYFVAANFGLSLPLTPRVALEGGAIAALREYRNAFALRHDGSPEMVGYLAFSSAFGGRNP